MNRELRVRVGQPKPYEQVPLVRVGGGELRAVGTRLDHGELVDLVYVCGEPAVDAHEQARRIRRLPGAPLPRHYRSKLELPKRRVDHLLRRSLRGPAVVRRLSGLNLDKSVTFEDLEHWHDPGDQVADTHRPPLLRRHLRRVLARLRVSISSRPAVADVRRQWGMEDLVGLEIELGDAVEYPLAGPE